MRPKNEAKKNKTKNNKGHLRRSEKKNKEKTKGSLCSKVSILTNLFLDFYYGRSNQQDGIKPYYNTEMAWQGRRNEINKTE